MAGAATCPRDDELARFLSAAVDPAVRRAIEAHLDPCARCREVIGHLAATGGGKPRRGGIRRERAPGRGAR